MLHFKEGAFALIFMSTHYPLEIVATRRGSPLIIGVKTEKKLKVDFVDVEFAAECKPPCSHASDEDELNESRDPTVAPKLRRTTSRAFLSEDGHPQPIEFFVSSDPAAIVEHTKRVLYLEDDDVSHIAAGGIPAGYFCRAAYPSTAEGRGHVGNQIDPNARAGVGRNHEGLLFALYAKGDFRAARVCRQHDARTREFRGQDRQARRSQGIRLDNQTKQAPAFHCVRNKLS